MDSKKDSLKNGMERYYGRRFLIPIEVLPQDADITRNPSFVVSGKFIEIDGKKFYQIEKWAKKR